MAQLVAAIPAFFSSTTAATAATAATTTLAGTTLLIPPAAAAAGAGAGLATAVKFVGDAISAVGAVGSLVSGNQQAKAAERAAAVAAGEERAKAQRAAIEQRKQGALVASRARAVGGASGGSSVDPTMVDILTGIESEGEYRAMTALYEGEDRARGIIGQGRADAYSAKQRGMSGFITGMSSVLSSASPTLYDKYAKTTPKPVSTAGVDYGTQYGPYMRTYQTPFGARTFYG